MNTHEGSMSPGILLGRMEMLVGDVGDGWDMGGVASQF